MVTIMPTYRAILTACALATSLALPASAAAQTPEPTETDEAVRQLQQRLAEVEGRLYEREAADERAAASASSKFSVRTFGRLHVDTIVFNQDEDNKLQVGNAPNGVDIRRARLGVEGEGFDTLFYRFDVDFVTSDQSTGQRPTIFDAYLDVQNLPLVGNVRIGHFREPFSLERLNSSNDFALLERSAAVNSLAPFRNIGLMAFNGNDAETLTWACGVFDENTNEFGADAHDRGGVAATGRVTWLPWYDEPAEGRYLWHVGASYSYRRIRDRQRTFAQTPEVILRENATQRTPNFIDTGVIPLEQYQLAGFETTAVLGSFSLQAEYVALFGEQVGGQGLFLHGGYVEAAYWLTGENRNYLRKLGIYGPVTPYSNFFRIRTGDGRICTGSGAWEVAARYSLYDADDRNVAGGVLNNMALGLNWYYAVRCRVMFDYVHAFLNRGGLNGNADAFAVRFQFAF